MPQIDENAYCEPCLVCLLGAPAAPPRRLPATGSQNSPGAFAEVDQHRVEHDADLQQQLVALRDAARAELWAAQDVGAPITYSAWTEWFLQHQAVWIEITYSTSGACSGRVGWGAGWVGVWLGVGG